MQDDGLPFQDTLTVEQMRQAIDAEGVAFDDVSDDGSAGATDEGGIVYMRGVTMRLEILRRTRPEHVQQELWTGLLANNLVRQSLLQSALPSGRRPHQLSFAAALQMLGNTRVLAPFVGHAAHSPQVTVSARERLITLRILNDRSHRVANRPNRIEPRAVKRRPSPLALLTELRAAAKARLLAGPKA